MWRASCCIYEFVIAFEKPRFGCPSAVYQYWTEKEKRSLRQFLVVMVCAIASLVLAGCGGGSDNKTSSNSTSGTSARTEVPQTPTPIPPTPTPTPVPLVACKTIPAAAASGLAVTAPATDVPKNISGYSGTWEGYWGGTNASSITFKTVTATQATATYIFTEQVFTPTFTVQPDGRLQSGGFVFVLSADGLSLDGTLTNQAGQVTGRVTMTRCSIRN